MLIPCLHDEPYAYQSVFQVLFSKIRGVIFNADAERDLLAGLYSTPDLEEKSATVGMGFVEEQAERVDLKESFPQLPDNYFLYSGRKEEGKNLGLLIEYFEKLGAEDVKLVLIGSGEVGFLEKLPECVVDLGFVSEAEKLSLFREALALYQPSVNESFSIVLMEAWLQGTPVVVHGNCAVTREHVNESAGGLYFSNYEEFERVSRMLLEDRMLRAKLGASGREYVRFKYSWEAVLERFDSALKKILAYSPKSSSTYEQKESL